MKYIVGSSLMTNSRFYLSTVKDLDGLPLACRLATVESVLSLQRIPFSKPDMTFKRYDQIVVGIPDDKTALESGEALSLSLKDDPRYNHPRASITSVRNKRFWLYDQTTKKLDSPLVGLSAGALYSDHRSPLDSMLTQVQFFKRIIRYLQSDKMALGGLLNNKLIVCKTHHCMPAIFPYSEKEILSVLPNID